MSEEIKGLSAAEELAQTNLEIAKLELEAKKLELEERKYNIKDLKAKIADRELRDKQIQEDRAQAGISIRQQEATDNYRFTHCTHKKGGMASARNLQVLSTGGNSQYYAVIKHQMINGDIWVRCLRCGRTWAPPVEKNFFFDAKGHVVAPVDGSFDKVRYMAAIEDYKRATMFETNNSMSTSVQCRFFKADETGREYDAAQNYRENIASTTLR